MPSVYNLYNKYVYIRGRWERLNDIGSGGSSSVLNFVESMSSTDFLALDLADLNVDDVYNIVDGFTTDSRFFEGAGIQVPDGTFIAVIQKGTIKYFNILGSAFNMDYIQGEIDNILSILGSLSSNWNDITNKPFDSIGEGLDVDENNNLNAKQLVDDIASLQAAIAELDLSWSNITGKPFTNIGNGLKVENGILKTDDVEWDNIQNKLFETLGSEFTVNNDVLNILSLEWAKITGKPFDSINTGDFYVQTYSNTKQLQLNMSHKHTGFYTEDLVSLKNIIDS